MDVKKIKSLKWNMILVSVAYIVLGVVLFIAPNTAKDWLCFLFGAFVLIIGLFRLITFFMDKSAEKMMSPDLASGILLIVFGIFLFLKPSAILELVPVVLGFIILYDSVIKFQNALSIQQMHFSSWLFFAILSAITAVLGIILIFSSFGGTAIMYYLAIVLIADGVANIIIAIALSILTGKFKKAVNNANQNATPVVEAEVVSEQVDATPTPTDSTQK